MVGAAIVEWRIIAIESLFPSFIFVCTSSIKIIGILVNVECTSFHIFISTCSLGGCTPIFFIGNVQSNEGSFDLNFIHFLKVTKHHFNLIF